MIGMSVEGGVVLEDPAIHKIIVVSRNTKWCTGTGLTLKFSRRKNRCERTRMNKRLKRRRSNRCRHLQSSPR